MEPKLEGQIDLELARIEEEVFAHLSFQVEFALADEVLRQLLQEDAPPEPEEYLLLKKLRVFSGSTGTLPLLVAGGYMDQPFITTLVIEACVTGERRYEAFLKQTQARNANSDNAGQ